MSDKGGYFPRWTLKTEGRILPDERLPAGQTVVLGLQHVVAMFGSTVLAPILMGFDPNVSILFSGISTLIFFIAVGGRVPSYLGSSFAFIGPVLVATGAMAGAPNPNIALALGGIIVAGAIYALIGLVVMAAGHRWIERLMPPVLTGAIVAAIGLVLAPIAIASASGISPASPDGDQLSRWVAIATVAAVGLVAVYAPGMARRLPILIGGAAAYILYLVLANGMGLGAPVDFSGVAAAAWFGLPRFTAPVFSASAVTLIAPVVIILVAENLGHIKAIGAMTGRNLDPYLGRAFIGDGIATMVSGSFGGTGMTTYAENIGVMAATKVYSTAAYAVAALVAILFGFSPKFGAIISATPGGVLGGITVVLYGMIGLLGAKIWRENRVDFGNPVNIVPVAAGIIIGIGDVSLKFTESFTLGGIALGTIVTVGVYHLAKWLAPRELADAAGGTNIVLDTPGMYKDDDRRANKRSDRDQ